MWSFLEATMLCLEFIIDWLREDSYVLIGVRNIILLIILMNVTLISLFVCIDVITKIDKHLSYKTIINENFQIRHN